MSNLEEHYSEDAALRTGEFDTPFVDLFDAITRAKELAAPLRGLRITLHLFRGEHFVLRGNSEFYAPTTGKDDDNTDYEIEIK